MSTIDLIALSAIPLLHPVLNHFCDDYQARRRAFVASYAIHR